MQVVIVRLLHRLGVIRVPTEYRESEQDKCLYTYLYNITYNASLIYAFNMFACHVTLPRSDVGGGVSVVLLGFKTL